MDQYYRSLRGRSQSVNTAVALVLLERRDWVRSPAGIRILSAAVVLGLMLCVCAQGSATEPQSSVEEAETVFAPSSQLGAPADEQTTLPVPIPASTRTAVEPPNGQWLTDEQGRSYFVDRIAKRHARRIDQQTVRTAWSIPIEVIREDHEYFYFKVYKVPALDLSEPEDETSRQADADHRPNAAEVAKVAATYQVEVKKSSRLRFSPFGQGLPSAGQWRDGFAVADMNGDGYLDIVHGPARKSLRPPVIFLGDGKGSWTRWSEASFPPLPYDYGDAQVGDFNGDGHMDIAFAVHLRGLLALIGDGRGQFTEAGKGLEFSTDGSRFSSRAIQVADWDGDSRPDILALGEGPRLNTGSRGPGSPLLSSAQGVVLYVNQGDGAWGRRDHGSGPVRIFGASLTLGDFNGDRRIDCATASSVQGRQDIVNLGTTDGSWETVTVKEVRPGALVRAVAAKDFDHDGRDDLVVAYLSYELATWRTGIDVLSLQDDGAWRRRTLAAEEGRRGVFALGSGDLDGDKNADLVALTGTGDVWVFLGDGKGRFTQEQETVSSFGGGCRGAHVVLTDLDNDGRSEVVASFADETPSTVGMTESLDDQESIPVPRCVSEGGIMAWKTTPASE